MSVLRENFEKKYGNRFTKLDHYLTTPSSWLGSLFTFDVPTFFYNHHKNRRNLGIPHNFRF